MVNPSLAAVAYAGAVLLSLMLVVALLALVRYLHHKETMRTLESGGDTSQRLESLSQARMEAQERRRLRSGMMAGVVVMALGLGILSNVLLRPQMMDPDTRAAAVGIVVVLLITGVANFVAHAIWSQRLAGAARVVESAEAREWRRIRSGVVRGSVVAAAGIGCLLALLAGVYTGDRGATAVLLGIGVFLLLSGAATIVVHVSWLRELERGRPLPAGDIEEGAIDRGKQSIE